MNVFRAAVVGWAELDATESDAGWRPIWTVVLVRPSGPMQVILDAVPGT